MKNRIQILSNDTIVDDMKIISYDSDNSMYTVQCQVCGVEKKLNKYRVKKNKGTFHSTICNRVHEYCIGDVINDVTVTDITSVQHGKKLIQNIKAYKVKCICGEEKVFTKYALNKGIGTKCLRKSIIDMSEIDDMRILYSSVKRRMVYGSIVQCKICGLVKFINHEELKSHYRTSHNSCVELRNEHLEIKEGMKVFDFEVKGFDKENAACKCIRCDKISLIPKVKLMMHTDLYHDFICNNGNYIINIGDKFEELIVTDKLDSDLYRARCEICGKTVVIRGSFLKGYRGTSHYQNRHKGRDDSDFINVDDIIDDVKIIENGLYRLKDSAYKVECQVCGGIKYITKSNLRRGINTRHNKYCEGVARNAKKDLGIGSTVGNMQIISKDGNNNFVCRCNVTDCDKEYVRSYIEMINSINILHLNTCNRKNSKNLEKEG